MKKRAPQQGPSEPSHSEYPFRICESECPVESAQSSIIWNLELWIQTVDPTYNVGAITGKVISYPVSVVPHQRCNGFFSSRRHLTVRLEQRKGFAVDLKMVP